MCINCYVDYGSPVDKSDLVMKSLPLINYIYEWNSVGSNLHIVIDDFNIEDDDINYCIKDGIPNNLHEASIEDLSIEEDLAKNMMKMSVDERATLLALHAGFIK